MTQIETASPPDSTWSIHWQYLLALLAIAILAILFHGIPILGRDYPTGPDYGQMRLAVSIAENGTLPVQNPYFGQMVFPSNRTRQSRHREIS